MGSVCPECSACKYLGGTEHETAVVITTESRLHCLRPRDNCQSILRLHWHLSGGQWGIMLSPLVTIAAGYTYGSIMYCAIFSIFLFYFFPFFLFLFLR
jgi:hypothetical protein